MLENFFRTLRSSASSNSARFRPHDWAVDSSNSFFMSDLQPTKRLELRPSPLFHFRSDAAVERKLKFRPVQTPRLGGRFLEQLFYERFTANQETGAAPFTIIPLQIGRCGRAQAQIPPGSDPTIGRSIPRTAFL